MKKQEIQGKHLRSGRVEPEKKVGVVDVIRWTRLTSQEIQALASTLNRPASVTSLI